MKRTLFGFLIGSLSLSSVLIASFALFQLAIHACPILWPVGSPTLSTSTVPAGWAIYQSRTLGLAIWHPADAQVFVNLTASRVDFEMGYPGQAVTLTVEEQTSSLVFERPDDYNLRSASLGCENYSTSTVLVGDHQFFSESCIWTGFRSPELARTVHFTELPV